MNQNNNNFVVALTMLDGLIAGIEMGSSIPVQLSELKALHTLLTSKQVEVASFPDVSDDQVIQPKPMPLYPTMASLQSVVDLAESQLPIQSKNAITGLLMTYHNTLLQQVKNVKAV